MLTVKALRARDTERHRWLSDGAIRGSGALWARISVSGGVSFYFRHTHDGKKKAVALGGYDEDGKKGLTLAQARVKAAELSKLYQAGTTDLHGHLDREREATERARNEAAESERRAAEDAKRGTLRQLLDAYVDHLKNKQSARDVHSIFTNHVLMAAPDLAGRKAAKLSVDDFVALIGRLVEAGKGRTADKTRSYLRAAYQLAIESKTNPAAPLALRAFGITVNPIASITALSQFNRTRDRVLSAPELGAYLRRVDALGGSVQRDALQVCLLLGGQRPTQLLRVRRVDVDIAAATITLYDGKGARSQPRHHALPLTKEAVRILDHRLSAPGGPVALFSTDSRAAMRPETLSKLVSDIATEMVKAGEAREPFQLRDLRRTCETMLAELKVSSDVCAQLLSHGLGGVQQRHYNRHSYALEKRRALEKWARHLAALKAGKTAEIVALPKRRRTHANEEVSPH